MRSFLLAVSFMVMGTSLAYGQSAKIGYIDLQRVIRESQAGKAARSAFEGEFQQKKNIIESKKNQLDRMKQEFINKASVMDEKARVAKAEEIDALEKDLERKRQDFRDELQKRDIELTNKILKELEGVIKDIGGSEGFTMILERTESGIVFASDGVDLTNKIIGAYDSKKRGAKN